MQNSNLPNKNSPSQHDASLFKDFDSENFIPPQNPVENMEEAAKGIIELMPKRTVRDRNYGPQQPLMLQPAYHGDFLDGREELWERVADSSYNLQDFSMPSEMLKHQEEPIPRDLGDEWFESNRPGPGGGMDILKDYDDRGWDPWDAPEMSEDKVNRVWPYFHPNPRKVAHAFLRREASGPSASSVVASYLMQVMPIELCFDDCDFGHREAKLLSDLEKSQKFTKAKGYIDIDPRGVSARLEKAEPRSGRYVFRTSSGGPLYTTTFQFIPQGTVREATKLHVRVSCTCPSWLFWGAQYNAVMGDYLYGKVTPKFVPPQKRDPKNKFLVCKHVLACIPTVSRYRLISVSDEMRQRLRRVPKIQVNKDAPKEKLRVPVELKSFERRPDIKEAVKKWDNLSTKKRQDFIMGLDSPGAVAFMAHRFPDTATVYVIEKLKDMALKDKKAAFREWAKRLLRVIV